MPPLTLFSAVLVMGVSPVDSAAVAETPPVAAVAESSLRSASEHIRQLAFDGDAETYFASEGNPDAADHFSLVFDKPVKVKSIVVATGRPDGKDKLEAGAVEVSTDGESFDELARFSDGSAHGEPGGREVSAIRIRPAADAKAPLTIRELTIESDPAVATFRYPIEFSVDVSDAPELKEWADKAARICERWYPRINDELKSDGYKPRSRVSMALKSSYRGVAAAGGGRITGSVKYFQAHPDDFGAMVHETVHIVQNYRGRGNPSWLVEGVADYIRFFLYEPGKIGRINAERAHYNNSYRVSASFLAYVTEQYDKELVLKLNKLMREDKYKEEIFKDLTGKTLPELDEEWRAIFLKP